MSIPWHNSNLVVLARISLSLPSSHTKLSPSFVIVDPIVFVYCFTIEGYNVFVTIEFFPHVVIMEDFLSMCPSDEDFVDVDDLLNL